MKSIKWILPLLLVWVACRQNEPVALPESPLLDVSLFKDNQRLPENTWFVDCRPGQGYIDGHMPGALSINRTELADSLGMVLPKAELETLLSRKGISSEDTLLLYDDNGSVEAARFWWVLHHYGFRNMQIIDGGFTGWKALGLPVETAKTIVTSGQFQFPDPVADAYYADMKRVETALARGNIKLVDNRSEAEYRGEERKEGASYAGRIEGSLHLDYYELIDTRPEAHQRLKPLSELKTIFARAGLQPKDTIINYCHSGVRSALVTFVMTQLLDYPHVQNYDGSWTEWSLYHPQWSKPL